jgi:hypothetical protein
MPIAFPVNAANKAQHDAFIQAVSKYCMHHIAEGKLVLLGNAEVLPQFIDAKKTYLLCDFVEREGSPLLQHVPGIIAYNLCCFTVWRPCPALRRRGKQAIDDFARGILDKDAIKDACLQWVETMLIEFHVTTQVHGAASKEVAMERASKARGYAATVQLGMEVIRQSI